MHRRPGVLACSHRCRHRISVARRKLDSWARPPPNPGAAVGRTTVSREVQISLYLDLVPRLTDEERERFHREVDPALRAAIEAASSRSYVGARARATSRHPDVSAGASAPRAGRGPRLTAERLVRRPRGYFANDHPTGPLPDSSTHPPPDSAHVGHPDPDPDASRPSSSSRAPDSLAWRTNRELEAELDAIEAQVEASESEAAVRVTARGAAPPPGARAAASAEHPTEAGDQEPGTTAPPVGAQVVRPEARARDHLPASPAAPSPEPPAEAGDRPLASSASTPVAPPATSRRSVPPSGTVQPDGSSIVTEPEAIEAHLSRVLDPVGAPSEVRTSGLIFPTEPDADPIIRMLTGRDR